MRDSYSHLNLETRASILQAYEDQIKVLKQTVLLPEKITEQEREQKLSAYVVKWMEDINEYTPRIVRLAYNHGKTNVVCIDNVDQLSPDYQAKIFLLAQKVAKEMDAVVIVALREESYYAASLQKAFTAYNNRKFHIASPPFLMLISHRLKYCRKMLDLPQEDVVVRLGTNIKFNREEISKFFDIIEYSIFSRNKNIVRFIESLSFGNMRESLDMFATFLYSGATNVDKMLLIYDRDGQYFVSFHEFAKSVILGDRRYYKDSESKILNLFDCGSERNSSHFIAIRLLALLLAHSHETCPEGRGFVRLDEIFETFIDIFDNEEDILKTSLRLLKKQLIQVDTRSTDSLNGASYMRVSSAGWYYFKYLVRAFAYLDLVFQDTPINDQQVAEKLKQAIIDVDAIADTQEFMSEKIELRSTRVKYFLDYLSREEKKEREKFFLNEVGGVLGQEFMPAIIAQCEKEIDWIKYRITERAEKQTDDTLILDEAVPILPLLTEEPDLTDKNELPNEN